MNLKASFFIYTNEKVNGADYLDIFKLLDYNTEFVVPEVIIRFFKGKIDLVQIHSRIGIKIKSSKI